jgi:uncharacterized membrane protein
MIRVLLVGESWSITSIHTKGFDSFTTAHYAEGGAALIKVFLDSGFDLTYMQSHIAASNFPFTVEELNAYDVILLSDIGSNTFLLPGSTFLGGNPSANRLSVIKQWVESGGGFGMIGGYLSFQGIEAKANYRNTVISEILPILMEEGDDREETPEGSRIEVTGKHQITSGFSDPSPDLLGYQRFMAKPNAQILATVNQHPFLVVGDFGLGRTLAYASDIGPHWAPTKFTDWDGFASIWKQSAIWLAGK